MFFLHGVSSTPSCSRRSCSRLLVARRTAEQGPLDTRSKSPDLPNIQRPPSALEGQRARGGADGLEEGATGGPLHA